MRNNTIKFGLVLASTTIGLTSVAGMAQDVDDLERKVRELNIMDNIFQAALEESSTGGIAMRRVSHPQSMYLADQGMVFSFRIMNIRPVRINGQNLDASWMEYMNDAMEVAAETLQRVEMSFPDLDFDYDFDGDEFFAGALPPQPPQPAAPAMPTTGRFFMGGDFDQDREAMRDMEESMRDTQREIRELQREIRELDRELRNAGGNAGNAQARIAEIETEIESDMSTLEGQQESYEAFITNLQDIRREQQLTMINEASTQIFMTLCDYGATLRSLGNNEHVTIILEDTADDTDQVYVFDAAEIRDCQSPDGLKESAVSYQMNEV